MVMRERSSRRRHSETDGHREWSLSGGREIERERERERNAVQLHAKIEQKHCTKATHACCIDKVFACAASYVLQTWSPHVPAMHSKCQLGWLQSCLGNDGDLGNCSLVCISALSLYLSVNLSESLSLSLSLSVFLCVSLYLFLKVSPSLSV